MPLPPNRKLLLERTAWKVIEEIEREWDERHEGADISRGNVEISLLTNRGQEVACRASFASMVTPNPLPAIGEVVLVSWDDAGVSYGRRTDTGDTIWEGGWEIHDSLSSPAVWRPGRKPDNWCPLPDWVSV